MPHVDRAGQIRKQTADYPDTSKKVSEEADNSDISSEEESTYEDDSDDVDSDGLGEDFMLPSSEDHDHHLTLQQDFVQF